MNLTLQNRRLTAPQIKKKLQASAGGIALSNSTIKRCLKEADLPPSGKGQTSTHR